jgi:hypothetical protein
VPFGLARGVILQVDFAGETRMYLDLDELEIARHIRRLCRLGMVCFDIGGQYGWHALALAKLGAKGRDVRPRMLKCCKAPSEPGAEPRAQGRRPGALRGARLLCDSTSWGPPISSRWTSTVES